MRPESKSAIDALYDTITSIKSELKEIDESTKLDDINRLEERMRNECQVIEALPGYMGQEIYRRVQARRSYIRTITQINAVNSVKETLNGSDRADRDIRGSDKPGGVKQKSDTKAKRPSRQSKSKK